MKTPFNPLFWLVSLSLVFFSFYVKAQQPGDLDRGFNPNARSNPILNNQLGIQTNYSYFFSIVVQGDDKIIVGGEFKGYNGYKRNGIARINADGSLDTSFNPGKYFINGRLVVNKLLLQPNGKIIMSGKYEDSTFQLPIYITIRLNTNGSIDSAFNFRNASRFYLSCLARQNDGKLMVGRYYSYSRDTLKSIYRLNEDGSVDNTFNVDTAINISYIESVTIQQDRSIVLGGAFRFRNTVGRRLLIRLFSNGNMDTTFNPSLLNRDNVQSVSSIIQQPNQKILVSGTYVYENGRNQGGITRLNLDGSYFSSFTPISIASNTNTPRVVSIALDSNGKIIIGGVFNYYGTMHSLDNIVRLNNNGTWDTTFSYLVSRENLVSAIAFQSSGKLIIGGDDGSTIKRLLPNGELDYFFNKGSGTNNPITDVSIKPDGKIIIAGTFSKFNNANCGNIAQLNNDGSLDSSFIHRYNANESSNFRNIRKVAIQPDGKFLFAGSFINYNNTNRNGIVRLNADGSLDTTFNSYLSNNHRVYACTLLPNGKILLGGYFAGINGFTSNLIRLNSNGSVDTTFNSNLIYPDVNSFLVQADGKILMDDYSTRLNPNGSIDTSFRFSGIFRKFQYLCLQSDGKILLQETCDTCYGSNRNKLLRLNANGSIDNSFSFNAGLDINTYPFEINKAIYLPNGKIICSYSTRGNFGYPVYIIIRLNSDGSIDHNFNSNARPNGSIGALALQQDGNILVGGQFSVYDNLAISNIARIYGGECSINTTSITALGDTSVCNGQLVTLRSTQALGYLWSNGDTSQTIQIVSSGIYSVQAINRACTSVASNAIIVTVADSIQTPVITRIQDTLRASTLADRYEWFNDNNIISNQTSRILLLSSLGNQVDGNYKVLVSRGPCQSDTSAVFSVTETKGLVGKATLTIYPNPAKDQFTIEVTNPTTVQVINTIGQVVISQAVSGTSSINTAPLPAGLYTVIAEGYKAVSLVVSK